MDVMTKGGIRKECAEKGISVDRLRDAVTLWGCRGVTPNDTALWHRLNALTQAITEEDRIAYVKANFILDDDRCPYCGTEARPTGGKRPTIYCPECNAYQVDDAVMGSERYVRWQAIE